MIDRRFLGQENVREGESLMKDENCTVLQFCSAVREGLDGITTESFVAENLGYKLAAEASSCPQSTTA
jgi:hypothetical protein